MYFFFFNPDDPEDVSTEEYKEKVSDFRSRKAEIDAEIDRIGDEKEPKNKKERAAYDEDSHKLLELSDESCKLEADINKMEEIIQSRRTFNKALFMKNIKALIAKTGVKIGKIEQEAQVSLGYLSRLGKDGNNSDPGLEFVATAARMLGTTIDTLLYGSIAEYSETDEYLIGFFSRVLADTKNDRIVWQTEKNMDGEFIPNEYIKSEKISCIYGASQNNDGLTIHYNSAFEKDVGLSDENNSYSAILPNTDADIFIMSCVSHKTSDNFYEVYICTPDNADPLCSTHNACDTIKDIIDKTYIEIKQSLSRIHISESTMNIIKAYFDGSDDDN